MSLDRGIVARLHAERPAVTEDLLNPARDVAGRNPYGWLAQVLPATGRVLDLGCGTAPLAEQVGLCRYVGVDTCTAELAEARRRRPGVDVRLGEAGDPPQVGAVAGIAVSMALMLIGLEPVLAVGARLLPAGAVVAATVPTRDTDPVAATTYGSLLGLLGQAGRSYPDPLDTGCLARRAAAGGFRLAEDQPGSFTRQVRDGMDAALVVDSCYAEPPPAARDAALRLVRGAGALDYPIRRLVFARAG